MKIDINDGTENTGMDLDVSIPGISVSGAELNTSATTITTTTSTTTITSGTYEIAASEEPVAEERQDPLPGYSGGTNCDYPMSDDRFTNARNSISSKDFEDSKLTIALQVIKSNCLYVSQIKQIMMLFEFEDTKLEFAKEAYNYTYDINNYYELNDVFDFESSTEELNQYINQ